MKKSVTIPDCFWTELEKIARTKAFQYSKNNVKTQPEEIAIPPSYWDDLRFFNENVSNKADYDTFNRLSSVFDEIRNNANLEIQEEKDSFPDNPVFLPFSLFTAMERQRDEVHHTKTLAWFMNNDAPLPPARSRSGHGFGDTVLQALWPLLSGGEKPIAPKTYSVISEMWLDNRKGRIDIAVMDGENMVVAIEAKIDSDERCKDKTESSEKENQLEIYDGYLDKHHPECIRVFLTPDGRTPKRQKKSSPCWKPVAWKRIAVVLLNYLRKADRSAPGYHYLRYFVAGIIQHIEQVDANDIFGTANFIHQNKENGNAFH